METPFHDPGAVPAAYTAYLKRSPRGLEGCKDAPMVSIELLNLHWPTGDKAFP